MPHDGLLFIYAAPRTVTFTMDGMLMPIDIAFLDDRGFVVQVLGGVDPIRTTLLPSPGPVASVLELRADAARQFGIAPGTTVHLIDRIACGADPAIIAPTGRDGERPPPSRGG